jgi:hypothetical protein
MDQDKDTSRTPGASVAPVAAGEVEPEPPAVLKQLEWLRRHGKRHKGLVVAGFLVTFVGWWISTSSGLGLLKNGTDSLVNWRIQRTVTDLRLAFPSARESLNGGSGDFREVEEHIATILKLDPTNGHALYYAGEVKRIKNKTLFTPSSCVKRESLTGQPATALESYQYDFLRYLDVEKSLADAERSGGYSAETCYERVKGYCPQRTAWVRHLLANDFYEQGLVRRQQESTNERLEIALDHAKRAAALYTDVETGKPGFNQCTPTTDVIAALDTR